MNPSPSGRHPESNSNVYNNPHNANNNASHPLPSTTTPVIPADPSSRSSSSDSDVSSTSSNVTTLSRPFYSFTSRPGTSPHPPRTSSIAASAAAASNVSLQSILRAPAPRRTQNEPLVRGSSPRAPPPELQRHRPRQHSQGFFEPSLPTASLSDQPGTANTTTMSDLSASRIAAQAAMQQQSAQHLRKRSQTIPNPHDDLAKGKNGSRSSPPPPLLTSQSTRGAAGVGGFAGQSYQNGLVGGHVQAATTAANVAFPRSPGVAVSAISFEQLPEREQKQKGEKSKMKLFSSKPKHIGISRDKDGSGKEKGLPSPNKLGFGSSSGLSRIVSASTTSLVDSASLNSPSMYSLSNASASTVVPADRHTGSEREKDREKDKDRERDKDKVHKPHFLSRQKLKLKDDHYNLPLSSASSNSKPLDPSAPQSLYSFTPSSPGPSSTTFGKSVTGLDLLHGGRALREKKKEEKAFAAASLDLSRESDPVDWLANVVGAGGGQSTFHGPSSYGSSAGFLYGDSALRETLQGFGLNNMTPEDVWDFLKAKLLVIFDGEDVRIAIEDLNKLVLIHIQRCVQKHMPSVIVEDLRDLLETGFASLNHSISGVPDEKLVPHLVQIWMLVFGTILPFIQAVFLPLDLEFKGRGSVMNAREAREFWGALPHADSSDASMGDELDVRTIVLVAFRDRVILNRYESLKSTFSRLSLDSINASLGTLNATPNSNSSGGRPGTATSLDTGYSSFNSQSSTLLNTVGNSSDSASASRSRATSNTSNPDQLIFQSFSSPPQRPTYANRSTQPTDCSHVITETVGRMLQCVSVLASVHTSDEPQERIEVLNKALKHNWLGRGRTGRDRRGFVGTRIRSAATPHQDGYRSVNDQINRDVASNWPNGNSNLSML